MQEITEEVRQHHENENHNEQHHHNRADEIFKTWGIETPHVFSKNKIKTILELFCNDESYENVLCAKGMVPSEEGKWIYFDMVPREYEIREESPDYTGRLCAIGTDINENELRTLFEI